MEAAYQRGLEMSRQLHGLPEAQERIKEWVELSNLMRVIAADAIAGGTAWQTAFQNSFGMTTAAFYSQFPAYRAAQQVPPSYLCGG